jgi:hypothetical protein
VVKVPLSKALGIVFIVMLASACDAGGAQSNTTASGSPSASASASAVPTTSASPSQQQASPSPPAATLVRCEDLQDQTFTSDTFRFSIGCPANFSWQTFAPSPGRLFDARSVDDRYLNGYPAGEVDISVVANGGNSLRDWVASHIGQQGSSDAGHFWDSTSNLADIQIAGRPALGFDYVLVGPEGPPTFQAAAFLLPEGSVLLMDWWAYSSDYRPAIAAVAQQMLASIQPFGA